MASTMADYAGEAVLHSQVELAKAEALDIVRKSSGTDPVARSSEEKALRSSA